jgi:hypothetical protein
MDIFKRRIEQASPETSVYLSRALSLERRDDQVQIVLEDSTSLTELNAPEHLGALRSAARDLIGNAASVSLIIKDEPPAPRSEKRAESTNSLESAREEPLVRRFLEVFRGDIAQIKPAKGE